MAHGIKFGISIFLAAFCLFLGTFSLSEEEAQPSPEPTKPPRVDAMYNKTATEGLVMRFPGPASMTEQEISSIKANGTVKRSDILDIAFSMLEEGNPFLERYNIITGANIQPLLNYGIPYFYGGRKMNYVLSNAPDYRTWVEWQDSRVYYRKDMRYFFGLDCRGFIEYVWKEAGIESYNIAKNEKKDAINRRIISHAAPGQQEWDKYASSLETGDVISILHPSLHILFFIGYLRNYGYTEADFPDDPSVLDYPLVIHCGVNAAYADWFYHLKTEHTRYKQTSVPDGGVSVSLLGCSNKINTIKQQKQYTYWILLPDESWLTVIPWEEIESWNAYR